MNSKESKQCPEILIVEDDSILATLHKYVVEDVIKREPLLFSNGKEAINFLDTKAGMSCDFIVLLDLNMPVLNGWEFLELCSKRPYANNIYVVIVTSSLFKEDRDRSEQFQEIIGYYTKPLKVEDFQEIMRLKSFKGIQKAPAIK